MTENRPTVTLEVNDDEALVLFDWLCAESVEKHRQEHRALDVVLTRIEGQLERSLTAVVDPNYKDLLREAKNRLTER